MMKDEVQKIEQRYQRRKHNEQVAKNQSNFYYNYNIQIERELKYLEILKKNFNSFNDIKLLEIGAGGGGNLLFFHRAGIPWSNIYANELQQDRAIVLKEKTGTTNISVGDALELNFNELFDVILQSTVFTSILNQDFKQSLAEKLLNMLKPEGFILWYDFKYNNPTNHDVKGVGKKEIHQLFHKAAKIEYFNVTLAPPIGRRIGKLYHLVNLLFPILRTHLIAVIHK